MQVWVIPKPDTTDKRLFVSTDGMFAAMHALTKEQIMDAELTRKIALEHDTVMVEQTKDGRGKGTILG